MALLSLLMPAGAVAGGIGKSIAESALVEHVRGALGKKPLAAKRRRNPSLLELADLDPEVGIPLAIAAKRLQRRQQEAEDNPDFFEDRRGVIHPIRASADYNDFMTEGARSRLRAKRPDLLRQLEVAGHSRAPRREAEGRASEERAVAREHNRDVKLSKPSWARGWSQADLHALADYAGVSRGARLKNNWADHVDPMAVVEFREKYGKQRLTVPRAQLAHDPAYKRYLERKATRRKRRNPDAYGYELPFEDAPLTPYVERYGEDDYTPAELAAIREQEKRRRLAELRDRAPSGSGRRRRRRKVKARDFDQGPQPGLFGDRAASDLTARDRGTYQYRFGNPGGVDVGCCRCGARHGLRKGATHFTCRGCGAHNGIRRSR